jgi:iron complex outermembrane receptor protein
MRFSGLPLALVALCPAHGQNALPAALEGMVRDAAGKPIAGAQILLQLNAAGTGDRSAVTDPLGRYRFTNLQPGRYALALQSPVTLSLRGGLSLEAGRTATVNWKIQADSTATVIVTDRLAASPCLTATTLEAGELPGQRLATSDSARFLEGIPGVSTWTGGGLSSLPAIHGLADDRVKVQNDGMEVSSVCPNHMNPPMSYAGPAGLAKVTVITGITPVSLGGDSLAGTIRLESAPPVFAGGNENIHREGFLSAFGRSNGGGAGASFAASVANSGLFLGYTGSVDRSGDYKDGQGTTVTSTYDKVENQALTFAAQGGQGRVVLKVGEQTIPYQGFVNQPMDMVSNHANFANLNYQGQFGWGSLDARADWQETRHEMNLGKDKPALGAMMWMPMDTQGRDLGYALKAEIPLGAADTLRLGNEAHFFTLNDWWPPVPGTGPWMAPNTFQNINDGRRDRYSLFSEWESHWSPHWSSLLGLRCDVVRMDTGNVQGYSDSSTLGYAGSGLNYAADAASFNAQSHARQDTNYDLTGLVQCEPGPSTDLEFGYGRKTRSPNLHERYAWSTDWMSSGMVNWFGDGNYYVGNLNLKPEVSHTVSFTADWHDPARSTWEIKATPYYTFIQDFIGVDLLQSGTANAASYNQLQFANHRAQAWGLDLLGRTKAWDDSGLGVGHLQLVVNEARGTDLDKDTGLYHVMPLNARVTLEQVQGAWTHTLEAQFVTRKTHVDSLRLEPETPGYSLLHLRSSYTWRGLRLDAGISNLFNKFYFLPLGGINYDAYYATNWGVNVPPVAGQGRSFNGAITYRF